MGKQGNLFLDAPKNLNFEQLCNLVNDHKKMEGTHLIIKQNKTFNNSKLHSRQESAQML